MKFTLPAALLAVAVSAQSTTGDSSCAAANIVDACLETTQGYLNQCTDVADYQCKCDKYTAIVTCFNNCPNDSRKSSFENSKQLYCMNASIYATATATATATSKASSATATAATTTAADKDGVATTASSSSAKPTATDASKNGAAEMLANTSGLMLAVAAIIAAVL